MSWGVKLGSPELMVAQLKFTGSAGINQVGGVKNTVALCSRQHVERRTRGREEQDPL